MNTKILFHELGLNPLVSALEGSLNVLLLRRLEA